MSRRGATALSGILLVDKPTGMTSHDVIASIRRVTGEKRIGHAGTLDPMASGLLVVLVGPATRLSSHITSAFKTYVAEITFGNETDTDDAEGVVVRAASVADRYTNADAAAPVVAGLVGTFDQAPPAFSAIKQAGRVAYRAARAGAALDLPPRTVTVASARLVSVDTGPPLRWTVELTASKGTYVRAIARDLGRQLNGAAHLSGLRRTASGDLGIDDAHSLASLTGPDDVASAFIDPLRALDMPTVRVDERDARVVRDGGRLTGAGYPAGPTGPVAILFEERLLAIYTRRDGSAGLEPSIVLAGGIGGVGS